MLIKADLENLIQNWLSTRKIAEHCGCSQATVKYWLKKYNLKTRRGPKGKIPKDFNTPRQCSCGETNPVKFYGNKRNICSKCQNKYNTEKGKLKRLKALEFAGAKCSICGYNKHSCSLDFHHTNPDNKDPNFSNMRGWRWERIKNEISKCVVLCRNCHHALHCGQIEI